MLNIYLNTCINAIKKYPSLASFVDQVIQQSEVTTVGECDYSNPCWIARELAGDDVVDAIELVLKKKNYLSAENLEKNNQVGLSLLRNQTLTSGLKKEMKKDILGDDEFVNRLARKITKTKIDDKGHVEDRNEEGKE